MRERHLMLVAWMSHPPSLAPLASQGLHNSSPMTGHNKETTHHGLALVSNSSSLLSWLAQALPTRASPKLTKAGHHEHWTPHVLAWMSKHLALLTWLARALTTHHLRTGHHEHWTSHASSLGLVSKHIVLLAWLARSSLVQHLMAGHHKGEAPHASSLDESTPSFAYLAI
ncbi:hypothetical protein TIFTF001_034399 [Ficus carica]|uniref:Uncharacterized protein n=1 Tax=Ficus carica TaxID=3494 RepID=A0AA88J8S7_FICCA|nr:hypothetical protein TIFTF001_034399 [Ficus carica]